MVQQLVRLSLLVAALTSTLILAAVPSTNTQEGGVRVPKQIHTNAAVVDSAEDHKTAETHFGGGEAHGHGKYFMYQHVPHKDHYEFGYRRGNEHHFKERYEKAHPHHGQFKTKARWGDKHGGYGEHYWDYNHAGHHGGDDGGSSDDEGGDGSEPVPNYQPHQLGDAQDDRVKREHEASQRVSDTPPAPASSLAPQSAQQDNSASASASATSGLSLAYDEESGTLVNEATGQRFLLTPIN